MDIETAVTRHSATAEWFAGFAASAFAGDAAALSPSRHAMVEGPGPGDDDDDDDEDDDERSDGDVGNIDPDDDEGYDDDDEEDDEEPLQV